MVKPKLVRLTTVPSSLDILLKGQLGFMTQYFDVIAISSDGGIIRQTSESEGFEFLCVEMTRGITPFKDLFALFKLYKIFKRIKPDIVHTHTPKAGTLGILAAKLAGVPIRLHTVAGLPLLESGRIRRILLSFVEKITYRYATFIYPNSIGLRDIIIDEKLCKPAKMKVLGNGSSNGINTSVFDPSLFTNITKEILKSKLNIKPNDFIFIFVGRLVGDKGVNELVDAFELLCNESKNLGSIKLLLVGNIEFENDPLRRDTLHLMESNENIICLGFQQDIRPFLAISDCFCFPSYREGFPNALLQACAMSLPCIASNINGCNEIISDGINGIIVPVKQIEPLFFAMKKIMGDPQFRERLRQNAREKIVGKFDQSEVWQLIYSEYSKLLNYTAKKKIIRVATTDISLDYLLKGQLAFLQESYDVLAVSNGNYHLKIVGERENVRTKSIPMARPISILKDILSLWLLFILFKREKPLIVHSITPKAGLLAMIAAFLARVPIRLHTFTGLVFPSKKGFIKNLLILMDRVLCLCATRVYPEGKGVKNDLIKFGITKKSLKILANGNVNGVDFNYFVPGFLSPNEIIKNRRTLSILPKDFVFIYVGRLVGDKGINELIFAFNELSKINKSVKLLLVGSFEHCFDPLEKDTLHMINSNNNIISCGFQSDIRPYFSISDCFVFPSYREGFPNALLEAGAMGLPSIVSDVSGSNEIIINHENGIIVPSKVIVELFFAMKQIIEDAGLRNRLKSNARSMVVNKYSNQLVWESVLIEYKNLEKYIY